MSRKALRKLLCSKGLKIPAHFNRISEISVRKKEVIA